MIQQIQRRRRPNFRGDDLLLHRQTDELSFLPSEFVPHTVNISLSGNNSCEFVFEYLIDETEEATKSIQFGIEATFGKYTNKVLKIVIDFNSFKDLIGKMIITSQQLIIRKGTLTKDSHRKNYDLVSRLFNDLVEDFSQDVQLKNLLA
jgi:hypothetical protein